MPVYNEKVMEHFINPHNVGEIENPDGIGEEGNPVCGDMMTFYIKVKDNHLEDVKFKTFGCGAAIAVSSMVSEMAKGKTLEEAMKITPQTVADELNGLPKNKLHCSNLGAQALNKAIQDYLSKKSRGRGEGVMTKQKEKKGHCYCPHCDKELMSANSPFCQECKTTVFYCPECQKPLPPDNKLCSHCGAKIKG
ncbi:Fe-S cluster assembly scaffold protein NifU [Chloroflexota bacterium]